MWTDRKVFSVGSNRGPNTSVLAAAARGVSSARGNTFRATTSTPAQSVATNQCFAVRQNQERKPQECRNLVKSNTKVTLCVLGATMFAGVALAQTGLQALPFTEPIRSAQQAQAVPKGAKVAMACRSEEHTSELQSRRDLVCRLLLE